MRKRRFKLDKTKITVSLLFIAALLVGCSGGGGGEELPATVR